MPTQAPTRDQVLDRTIVFGLCSDENLAKLTWDSLRAVCDLVIYAKQHPEIEAIKPLLEIQLDDGGMLNREQFRLIMSMAAMTHGTCFDGVTAKVPEIEPPMFLIQPSWTRVHQLALIHLFDAIESSF